MRKETKLKVGIVGAAGRGRGFFSAFTHNPRTELAALCDLDMARLKETADPIGVKNLYRDYGEMLEKSDLDIVVVGTPMPLHVPQSIMALSRNIHVISEVPAAVSLEEARELVLAADASRATYMMAENYCYMRNNVLVREIARRELFGEIYYGEGAYIHELKELNEKTRWRRKWQAGIPGCTYGTHSLGPVYQWFGEERVIGVSCVGSGHHYTDPRGDRYETDDSTAMLCRMEKGGLVNVRVDMLSNRPHQMTHYQLQGTEGAYLSGRGVPGDEPQIWLASRSVKPAWEPLENLAGEFLPESWRNPSGEQLAAGHGGGDYLEIQEFVEAVIRGAEPPIGIHQAMDITLPGLVSQRSIIENGAWLEVPDSRDWK